MVKVGKGYRQQEDRLQTVKDYLAALARGDKAQAERIKKANPEIEVWP